MIRNVVIGFAFAVVACGDSPTAVERAAGTYDLVEVEGEPLDCMETASGFVRLREDGTFRRERLGSCYLGDYWEEGEYRIDGNEAYFFPREWDYGRGDGWEALLKGNELRRPDDDVFGSQWIEIYRRP